MSFKRNYAIYDVFTDKSLAGNPLAVVFDTDGLDTQLMQKIAAEFNLSETIFVLHPEHKDHAARLRIFMPRGELPFAGHPTVGGTVALCERNGETTQTRLVLEEAVGSLNCIYKPGDVGYAHFELPVLPQREDPMMPLEAAASSLGLSVDDIGFDDHELSQWSAGKAYLCVPVKSPEVLARVTFNEAQWLSNFPGQDPLDVDCPYIYCRLSENDKLKLRARMFAPHHGIPEDPATGSAAAALCGALHLFEKANVGTNSYVVEQGVEMGRPSRIFVEIDAAKDAINIARIGGHAVRVAEGVLLA